MPLWFVKSPPDMLNSWNQKVTKRHTRTLKHELFEITVLNELPPKSADF